MSDKSQKPETSETPKTTAPAAAAAPAAATPAKPTVDTAAINGAFMLPPQLAKEAAPKNNRNERQSAMDDKVKELHAAWIKADRPTAWPKLVEANVVATWFVEPDKAPDLHKLIRNSVAFHGLRAVLGTSFKVSADHVKAYGLPAEYEGREAVSVAIRDKRGHGTAEATATEQK